MSMRYAVWAARAARDRAAYDVMTGLDSWFASTAEERALARRSLRLLIDRYRACETAHRRLCRDTTALRARV